MAKKETRKYRVIDGPIHSADTEYEIGDELDLTEKQAAGLAGYVQLVKETPAKPADKKGDEK